MRLASKEALQYACLLICLFGIAALAVWHVLAYVGERLRDTHDFAVTAALVCVITFGFMLIAGAFGLWGMKLAAAAEGRRRVGRLIEAMDYIQDGLVAIDRRGRITGSNPAVRSITGAETEPNQPLGNALTCLTEADVHMILESRDPEEIERRLARPEGVQTLRFRSQPIEGMVLLLVSDVTRMEARRLHNRVTARLQLIGQIARGVAYDFNNLLCAISGHASLLSRLPPDSPEVPRSIRAIAKGAERGTTLAAHLLELSLPVPAASFPRMSMEFLQAAVASLRDSLADGWQVEARIDAVPPMSLTGLKIEQLLLNLGLLVADRAPGPGILRIVVSGPREDVHLLNAGHQFAGVLLVAATPPDVAGATADDASASGVIVSVIRTMVEQANGTLECFRAPDGSPIFRVALPREHVIGLDTKRTEFAAELAPYVANWRVLLIQPGGADQGRLEDYLRSLAVHVEPLDSIVAALARMEDRTPIDAIVIDRAAMPVEPRGLLRAMLKLCPSAALVVIGSAPDADETVMSGDIAFVSRGEAPERALLELIEARSLAVKRRPA